MVRNIQNNQTGAASILIVMFMTIILTIVTIGFLRIALNEQRISTDDDLATRAFYAAESGIEDARRAINEYLGGDLARLDLREDECRVPNSADYSEILSPVAEFDTSISCMLIDFQPNSIRSELSAANQTRQYDIVPVDSNENPATPGFITLRWHIDADLSADGDGEVPSQVRLRDGSRTLPAENAWQSGGRRFPAMMQVNFISYPDTGFGRGDIISSQSWLSPGNGSGTTGNVFTGNSVNGAIDGEVLVASCANNDGDYACEMRYDLRAHAGNRNLVVRVTNLYEPTSFEFTMLAPNGTTPLSFDEVQAVVDVTGRAGGVSRRIEAVLDLTQPNLVSDFTIMSAEDICKDFIFTDNPSQYRGQLNSSCQSP